MSFFKKNPSSAVFVSEHQQNMRKESKEDKQTIEQLETDTDDLAETLCTSKINSLLILKTNSKRHTMIII